MVQGRTSKMVIVVGGYYLAKKGGAVREILKIENQNNAKNSKEVLITYKVVRSNRFFGQVKTCTLQQFRAWAKQKTRWF